MSKIVWKTIIAYIKSIISCLLGPKKNLVCGFIFQYQTMRKLKKRRRNQYSKTFGEADHRCIIILPYPCVASSEILDDCKETNIVPDSPFLRALLDAVVDVQAHVSPRAGQAPPLAVRHLAGNSGHQHARGWRVETGWETCWMPPATD